MFCLLPVTDRLLSELYSLERSCFTDPWSEKSLHDHVAARCRESWSCLLGFQSRNQAVLCGYCLGTVIACEGEILRLAIKEECRRRGGARFLLAAALAELAGLGVKWTFLEVAENNRPALSLYLANGFKKTGSRPGYYDRGKTAAWLMAKKIG